MDRTAFMQACRDGGRAAERALRVLHHDYAGALLNDAWQSLRNTEQAQDLLQETLLKAWRHCSSFRGDSELFPWLKQVLRHAVIDWLRRGRPESSIDEPGSAAAAELEDALRAHHGGPDDSPEGQLAQQQLDAVYRRCAERFAADHPQAAAVIRWIAEDDLGPAEIAQLLQRSPGATREFISQCRKKARHYFHDWYLLAAGRPVDAPERTSP
ncbi:MAG: sigma-70 family RNA polymerase sigma factor [Rubrivivax sp.]|nr:sigma-70 family RNA polymerase sigma factor [Rubrivivax sp.]